MEKQILIAIQSFASPLLDVIMQGITMIGETPVIIGVVVFLFYGYDKQLGKRCMILFGGSMLVNLWIKDIFKLPRPIGQEGIRSLRIETATGYSFPSGHTQAFASLFFSFLTFIKNRKFLIGGAILLTLVGLSRMYLGVHWPKDVLFGIIFAYLSIKAFGWAIAEYGENTVLAVIIIALQIGSLLFHSRDMVKMAGVMMGAGIGIWLEERYIGFENPAGFSRRLFQVMAGVLGILIVYAGLKLLFPVHLAFDYLRYFLVGITACAVMPYCFSFLSGNLRKS